MRHQGQGWFQLKPDLLIRNGDSNLVVLDTKWKLLDGAKANSTNKYGLSQTDFYQLQAYGQSYLDGQGDTVLIYPKTDAFQHALPVFEFPKSEGLRLWVVPFCLASRQLQLLPDESEVGLTDKLRMKTPQPSAANGMSSSATPGTVS